MRFVMFKERPESERYVADRMNAPCDLFMLLNVYEYGMPCVGVCWLLMIVSGGLLRLDEAPERWMPVNLFKHSNGKRISVDLR